MADNIMYNMAHYDYRSILYFYSFNVSYRKDIMVSKCGSLSVIYITYK